ncbi:Molybdopterin molybdenumtransferase [compost metagenome]
MISVDAAREWILRDVVPGKHETVPLLQALGKILAEPVVAPLSLPPFDNSAMDGFAVRVADLEGAAPEAPLTLPIAMEVAAGSRAQQALEPGTACRIMTGSPIPPGADAVVKVEDVRESGGWVSFARPVAVGHHIRPAGEDLRQGERLLEPGVELTPARIALLAGIGKAEVRVHAAPRVAILTTGDELVQPGTPLQPGQIFDSNTYAMAAMVAEAGGIPVPLGVIKDDRDETRRLLEEAASYDVVLTSGGVSMGSYDYVGETLREQGILHFDRVAQQPGKPFTYATLGGKPVFALPGNPVSTMVCFEIYVRPALRRMRGHRHWDRVRMQVTMRDSFSKKPGRQTFLRAIVERTPDGAAACLAGAQGSAILSSMARANALLIVPAEVSRLEVGQPVEALVLSSLDREGAC